MHCHVSLRCVGCAHYSPPIIAYITRQRPREKVRESGNFTFCLLKKRLKLWWNQPFSLLSLKKLYDRINYFKITYVTWKWMNLNNPEKYLDWHLLKGPDINSHNAFGRNQGKDIRNAAMSNLKQDLTSCNRWISTIIWMVRHSGLKFSNEHNQLSTENPNATFIDQRI